MIDHLETGPEARVRRRRNRAAGTDDARSGAHRARLSRQSRHPRTHGRLLDRLRVDHRLRQPRRRILLQFKFNPISFRSFSP